jgi:uncharacterized protein
MRAISYLRYALYIIVFIGISSATAGSYDDFFAAVRRDDGAAVTDLLQRGFDPNSRGPEGQSGLMLAVQLRTLRAAQALLDHPALEIDALNLHGESALMLAALKGELSWTQKLLERGARVNLPGWSPLHYAATGGDPRVVELLLDRGADVNADSPNRTTPLMMAARYGSEESVRLLLLRGADPTRRNERELRAADFARQAGRDSLAARLEEPRR